MLGAVIGDIVGSVYEFHNYRRKDFEPFFHRKAFFTDDTVCRFVFRSGIDELIIRKWGEHGPYRAFVSN